MHNVTPAQREVAIRHQKAEEARDVEETMATVAENPRYEMPSLGLAVEGREAVREFYRRTLTGTDRGLSAEMRLEGVAPNALLKENLIYLNVGGERVTSRVLTVLLFEGDLVLGERIYADPPFTKKWIEDLGPDFADFPGVVPLK